MGNARLYSDGFIKIFGIARFLIWAERRARFIYRNFDTSPLSLSLYRSSNHELHPACICWRIISCRSIGSECKYIELIDHSINRFSGTYCHIHASQFIPWSKNLFISMKNYAERP